jgi:UDP-N-acetylmuramoyl-L-alanyl-D-glutamate--2,6-diaminopimelate ligase
VTHVSPNRAGISLRELFADEARGGIPRELRATSCTSDWRFVRPGDVFVAITEAESDGHDHGIEAARRGAAAIICERPLPEFTVPQCIVSDSRAAYGRLCQALAGSPSLNSKVIGVTGTHGKTTVSRLLTAIFRQARQRAGTLDSFGYWDGLDDRAAFDASLAPPLLARSLAQMAAVGASHAVVEMSSRELSRQVLAGVTLDAVCITNVSRNHLDWHGSVENYREAKRQIFEYLQPDGVAVLNSDDPVSVRMLSELNFPALTYGLEKPAEVTAHVIEQHVNEQIFLLNAGDDSVGVRTAIIGDHHIYNCLAAATTALAYGIDLTVIARGLESVEMLPGRMERVACGQDYTVFVDAADTSESLRACLQAARRVTSGRVICAFGADPERESGDWPAMGRVVGALADVAVVTNNASDTTSHRACIALHGGFADRRKARVIIQREEAIAWALRAARAGDTVVVAGVGERISCTPHNDDPPVNDQAMIRQILSGESVTPAKQQMAA